MAGGERVEGREHVMVLDLTTCRLQQSFDCVLSLIEAFGGYYKLEVEEL